MTHEEKMLNGTKFDSISMRQDLEKFNFSTSVFFITWMALEVIPHNLIGAIIGVIVAVYGIYHGMRMMMYLAKYDYLFMGQFVRDTRNVAKWIVKKFSKPDQYDQKF